MSGAELNDVEALRPNISQPSSTFVESIHAELAAVPPAPVDLVIRLRHNDEDDRFSSQLRSADDESMQRQRQQSFRSSLSFNADLDLDTIDEEDFVREQRLMVLREQTMMRLSCLDSDEIACQQFFEDFMDHITSKPYVPMDSAVKMQAVSYCHTHQGRIALASVLETRRGRPRLQNATFNHLLHLMVHVFNACLASEDFLPARNFLNMCFTYYHVMIQGGRAERMYLYSELVREPVWVSTRFWECSFFYSLAHEKRNHQDNDASHEYGDEEHQEELLEQDQNLFFGQLSAYISNMTFLQVSRQTIDAFISKMTTAGDISHERIQNIMQTVRKSCPIKVEVTLENGIMGYGVELGEDSFGNVVVASVGTFGAARRSGLVVVGQLVLQIDGEDTSSSPLSFAKSMLDRATENDSVKFIFAT